MEPASSPSPSQYALTGSGPRILLLHSGFMTWVEWRRTVALLEGERTVLAPTQAGSAGGPRLACDGRSMLTEQADHLETLLDELGWTEPVDVLGSSFGSVLGMELVNRGRAARVLALAPPWVAPGAGVTFYLALFSPLLGVRLTRPVWRWSTRSGAVNGLFFHSTPTAPQIDAADVATMLDSIARFPFVRIWRSSGRRGPGMPALTSDVEQATTLVWGTADRYVPAWMRRRWEQALPRSAVVMLPGFPHQPHLRDPERVASLVREVLC